MHLSCWFWVVVAGLFYGIIFLNNRIDVYFNMLQMILMNTDICEIPPSRYDPYYLLCVMRLLPFNSIHSLLLVCYMHTCMYVCGSVTWTYVHMCVFVTQLWWVKNQMRNSFLVPIWVQSLLGKRKTLQGATAPIEGAGCAVYINFWRNGMALKAAHKRAQM